MKQPHIISEKSKYKRKKEFFELARQPVVQFAAFQIRPLGFRSLVSSLFYVRSIVQHWTINIGNDIAVIFYSDWLICAIYAAKIIRLAPTELILRSIIGCFFSNLIVFSGKQ
jgi:hypothetical protein